MLIFLFIESIKGQFIWFRATEMNHSTHELQHWNLWLNQTVMQLVKISEIRNSSVLTANQPPIFS